MGSADSVRNVATGEHGSRRGSPSTSAARPGSPPSPRLWVALAVGLGIVSTTLGVLVVKRLNDAAMAKEDPGRKMDIIAVRDLVSSLEGRLAGAEKDLQRLQPPAAPPQATLEAQPERPAADRASPLDQRIGAMERRLAEIGEVQLAQAREPAKIDVAGQKYDPAMIPTLLSDRRKMLFDTARPASERLEALHALRMLGATKDEQVARAALGILDSSSDALTRVDVVRQLSGARVPIIVEPLLRILAAEPDGELRSKAAEVLRDYTEQPQVQGALERAAASDISEGVRSEARRALEKKRK